VRVAALQKRWDCLRAGLDLILDQRGADMADLTGATTGKGGRSAGGRINPGVVSLVAELRGHQRQAAEELEWKTAVEERKVIDASSAAITLELPLTGEELDSLEKRAGDGDIAGRGRTGGSDESKPSAGARHGEPAEVVPANAVATDDRGGWMA
jgi:hypothetical protein